MDSGKGMNVIMLLCGEVLTIELLSLSQHKDKNENDMSRTPDEPAFPFGLFVFVLFVF